MNSRSMLAIVIAGLSLTGCASTYSFESGFIDRADFGEANRQTFDAMVVNPNPVYTQRMITSAQSVAAAAARVRDRQVVQPEAEDTTQLGTGGGG